MVGPRCIPSSLELLFGVGTEFKQTGCSPRVVDTTGQTWEGSVIRGESWVMRWKPAKLTRLLEAKADVGPKPQSPQSL